MAKEDAVKSQIRCLIANVYDLQKLRISAGNRLVQSFYLSLGVEPSTSPEDADKEEKKMIDKLKSDYKRITDAIAEALKKDGFAWSVKKAIRELQKKNELSVIRDDMDYKLIESYMFLLKSEEEEVKVLDKYVQSHPLYDAFFKDVKGCGTLMSSMCIAYLDPYKARYVSSFYKYCGLDTVRDTDEDGNPLFITANADKRKVRQKFIYLKDSGENYTGKVKATDEFDAEGNRVWLGESGETLIQQDAVKNINGHDEVIYEDIETGAEYIGNVFISEHGRRKGDTEMFEYIDKDGKTAMKRGITYNPVLKTKLMGVLTGCLLKAKDPTYSKIYYDYRARLDKEPKYANATDGHKNMMAQRYMIKQFLRNLWVCWRELEGLEVNFPYEVAKLGNKPHKYNQYQCDEAEKWQSK